MYPVGHLALGYLAGVGVARASGRTRPRLRQELLPLWIGALLPDLVDKPAYLLGLADATRWAAHSPLFVLLLWGLWFILHLRGTPARPLALLTLGVISHQAADLVDGAVSGLLFPDTNLISTWFTWPFIATDTWAVELDSAIFPFKAPITPLELLVVAAALAVAWHLRGNFRGPRREQPRNPDHTLTRDRSPGGRPSSHLSSS